MSSNRNDRGRRRRQRDRSPSTSKSRSRSRSPHERLSKQEKVNMKREQDQETMVLIHFPDSQSMFGVHYRRRASRCPTFQEHSHLTRPRPRWSLLRQSNTSWRYVDENEQHNTMCVTGRAENIAVLSSGACPSAQLYARPLGPLSPHC